MMTIDQLPGVRRIENCPLSEMNGECMERTHAVYPHDQMFGRYCSLEEHIDCPPKDVFRYLADGRMLAEWTYSMRDIVDVNADLLLFTDKIGGATKIYCRTVSNASAMTVDYHCAWDQGEKLWMIYLMRVIPAELVLDRPGSVVLWSNCRHPFYEKNPWPEYAPPERKVWVGDLWPFFYAGHDVEMQNLKAILEHRHKNRLPIIPGKSS